MRKNFIFWFLLSVALIVGAVLLPVKQAEASSVLAVGEQFTVENITYHVTSTTSAYEVEAISAALKLTTVTIPSSVTYNGITYTVTSIPDGAFYGNGRATKLIISEGIKKVGASAFMRWDAVTEIVLPSTLETFTTMGFMKLETISLPSENQYFQLREGVLFSKDGSKLWLYPSGKSENSYTVPSGTTTIVEAAFYQNQNLQIVTLPVSVTTIEAYAFDALNSLTSITFGNNVSNIGDHNLRTCPSLKSIVLKNSGKLGNYCIYDCPSLETITIDGNMSGYGWYVFYNLPSLKKYEVKNSPYYSDQEGVLYNKGQLLRYPSAKAGEQYIVPEETTKIAGLAFNYMQNLKEIILNPGVYVELMAFHYPNTNAPISVHFRDKGTVSMSKSSSGVFVGLNSGSRIYLPTEAALSNFQGYGSVVNPKGSVTVSVKTIPATRLKISQTKLEMKKGESVTLTGTLTPYYSTDEINWSSSNSKVATVSADGVIVAVGSGECKITATTDSGISKSCTVTVIKESTSSKEENGTSNKDKDAGSSSSTNSNQTSSEKKESSNILLTETSPLLSANKNFLAAIKNNATTGNVAGSGIETGSENGESMDRVPYALLRTSLENIVMEPIKATQYTGKELTPDVVLKDGDMTLVRGEDYTLEYKKNVGVGTATVIIKGIGNYNGTLTTSFRIVKENVGEDLPSADKKSSILVPVLAGAAVILVAGAGVFLGVKKKYSWQLKNIKSRKIADGE